ncbi:MAG TPA: phosphoglycerate dehydrogenase [Myxococcaceae bacterium]|nr:phosphoglycerate dehydrogenase [Myxococcaceae bacterium]
MSKLKILLLESIHPVADELLEAEGLEVLRAEGALKEDQLAERLKGIHLVGIRSKTQVTRKVLEAADSLIAVGAFCIGTNQIALEQAMKRGVAVFNAPFSNTRSVAEMVIAEIVMLSRHLGDRSREMHQGVWRKVSTGSREVRGKTLGVVGYGHIGSQVSILAEDLGMKVVFHDTSSKLPLGNSQPVKSLDTLLEQSDFVTLHVPETPQTRGMIGAAQLARMKKGASLINASRGTVVDLEALAQAIREKRLDGAAVDVYPEEPEGNSAEGFQSTLRGLPNVVMTPHIGGSTLEAQEAIGREVSVALSRFASTGTTVGSVNFPPVELARTPGTWRLINVHQNVPGVLRDLNRIVSDREANIHAQVLSTNAAIGYLIMDLDSNVAAQVVEDMRRLPTTISARTVA